MNCRLALVCIVAACAFARSAESRAQTPDTRASLIDRAQAWSSTDIAGIGLPARAARGRRGIDAAPLRMRLARVALAALLFAAAWWGTYAALEAAEVLNTPAGALLAGAVPAFVLLPGPLYIGHLMRTWSRRIPIHA